MPKPDQPLERLIDLVAETKTEVIALQSICSALLAEVALLSLVKNENPREKLGKMTAGLQGMAHGVAVDGGVNTQALTATIERVCAMAEASLQDPKSES